MKTSPIMKSVFLETTASELHSLSVALFQKKKKMLSKINSKAVTDYKTKYK